MAPSTALTAPLDTSICAKAAPPPPPPLVGAAVSDGVTIATTDGEMSRTVAVLVWVDETREFALVAGTTTTSVVV